MANYEPLKSVRYIVIHTAADPREKGTYDTSIEDIRSWHLARGWSAEGYHYLVRRDGTVQKGRPETAVGAHTRGLNHQSIGVCLSGHGDLVPPTDEQMNALIQLLITLCKKYNLSADAVIGHREVNRLVDQGKLDPIYRTSKSCPGHKVSVVLIRSHLRKLLGTNKKVG